MWVLSRIGAAKPLSRQGSSKTFDYTSVGQERKMLQKSHEEETIDE